MSEKKFLEDYRDNNYLTLALTILSVNNYPIIELTYNQYAIHGFYNTMYDIQDLENEDKFINNGRRVGVSISMWYLALEAYINILCKIVGSIKNKPIEPVINSIISKRISFLILELGYDNIEIKKTGIFNRVNEFRQFRNEIFHDRNIGNSISFKKTMFSPNPNKCNQVDTFQATIIFIEIVNLFRFSIPALDLMPNISIGKKNIVHFDKLDILYNKFLINFFNKTLRKRQLETQLDLNVNDFINLPPSTLLNCGEIVPILKNKQDFKYIISSKGATNIGGKLYNEVLNEYNLQEKKSNGLNFISNLEELSTSRFPTRR